MQPVMSKRRVGCRWYGNGWTKVAGSKLPVSACVTAHISAALPTDRTVFTVERDRRAFDLRPLSKAIPIPSSKLGIVCSRFLSPIVLR